MSHPRPFRFGLLGENVRSAKELVDTAHRAEEAGFATFLLRDHFIAEPFGHQLAPLAALATVAAGTTRLRVGTMGLGAGFSRPEYEAAGLPCDPAGVRVDRFAEALQVLKGLFGATPCTFAGRFYTVTHLEAFPKPVQQPHPPLLVGAGGRRMLAIAAREANIIGLQTASLGTGRITSDASGLLAETIAEKIGWVRQEAGARFDQIELSILASVVAAEDRRAAAERLVRERGWDGLPLERVFEMPSIFIGSVARIVDDMQARRERYNISHYVVRDGQLEMVAPIVACLAEV